MSTLTRLRCLASLTAILVMISATPAMARGDRVVVPGDPPLFRQVVNGDANGFASPPADLWPPAHTEIPSSASVQAPATCTFAQWQRYPRQCRVAQKAYLQWLEYTTSMCQIQNFNGRDPWEHDYCRELSES